MIWRTAAISGSVALTVYALTLWPTVPGGDSGELIAVAHTLGIAHPPGYPLYTLLGKLFSWIPAGSIAWRVNLLSAVCDAASVALLFAAVARWTLSLPAALGAAGLYAFSPLVWTYATQAEVFALNNLFVTALLYLAVVYHRERSRKTVDLAAIVFGIGLANHHTLLFVGVPIGLWMLRSARDIPRLALLSASGLLFYLYLPWAGSRHPAVAWGDPASLDGFLTHFLRKEYGTFQLGVDGRTELFKGLYYFVAGLPAQLLYVGVIPAALGIRAAVRRGPDAGLGRLTCVIVVVYLVAFNALANLPIEDRVNFGIQMRFWQQALIFVFAWVGIGLARLPLGPPRVRWAVAAGLAALQLGVHYRGQDQHRNQLYRQFGRAILAPLPKDSLLLSRGDMYTNTALYLQQVEGFRRDVRVLDRQLLFAAWRREQVAREFPELRVPQGVYRFRKGEGDYALSDLLRANMGVRPVFLCNMAKEEDHSWESELQSWPFGLVNEVLARDGGFDARKYLDETRDVLRELDSRSLPAPDGLVSWEFYIWNEYWEADHRRARRLLTYAIERGDDPGLLREAARILEDVAKRHPAPPPALFKNLGYAYNRLGARDGSAVPGMARAWGRYLTLVSEKDDPDLPTIRQAVERVGK